jgi:hypothetical protein
MERSNPGGDMRAIALLALLAFSTVGCATIHNLSAMSKPPVPPVPGDIVGTDNVCPNLNAHRAKACRFDRKQRLTLEETQRYRREKNLEPNSFFGFIRFPATEPIVLIQGFQVWPDRISIIDTGTPGSWLVTDRSHPDGMFDHTLRVGNDDHVSYKCIINSDGSFHGPYDFRINYGGVWNTYGAYIKSITTGSLTIVGAGIGGTAGTVTVPIAGSVAGATIGSAAGATVGVIASEALKEELSKMDDAWWEQEAAGLTQDICQTLATKAKAKN